jgi:lipid-A-disaccharide synthase-like uncharacterized protein
VSRVRAAARLLPVVLLLLVVGALGAADSYEHNGAIYEGRGHMNRVLVVIDLPFTTTHWTVTGWKILGFVGAFCFAGRWLVQAWHRKRTGAATMPTVFWIISLAGAGMVTAYFIWGKNDSVGIITNALPASVALYNLIQDLKQRRAAKA